MTIHLRISSRLLISGLLLGLGVFTPCTSAQEKPATKIDTPRYKAQRYPLRTVSPTCCRNNLEAKVDKLKWDWQQNVSVIDPTGTITSEEQRGRHLQRSGVEI